MRKKIISWLLVFALVVTMIPATAGAAYAASYSNFDGVKYSISSGVLTIAKGTASGEYAAGEMRDNVPSYSNWRIRSDEITEIVIEDGVTYIGSNAFNGMTNVTDVKIAGSVKTIGEDAFNSNSLTSVELGEGIETISTEAFYACSSLKEVTIPASVKTIGTGAFQGCSAMTAVTLNEGLEDVETRAFYNCTALADIAFPASIKSVGKEVLVGTAFADAQSGNDMVVCGTVVVANNRESYADYPCVIPAGVICVADNVFQGITMYELQLPGSLIYIGDYAFAGANRTATDKKVPSMDFRNVEYIGNHAFEYWIYIKDADLSNVTYIGDYGFYDCEILTTVELAPEMEYLGELAFSQTGYLTSISVPDFIKFVDTTSFKTSGTAGDAIYNDADGDGFTYHKGMLLEAVAVDGMTYPDGITIADGTYTIASRCFNSFNPASGNPTAITIPESVVSIGSNDKFYSITDVYYAGSMNDWNKIAIQTPANLAGATIHCAKSSAVSMEDCTVKLAYTSKAYTGKALTPAVTVTDPDGKVLTSGTDYAVTYTSNLNAGTAKATVTGQGNYTGTVEKTFTITKVAAADVTVKLSYAKTNYNGKQKTPGITVTDNNGNTLVNGEDYTVSYNKATRKAVGRYSVTVNLKGNYSGSKTSWFTIVPGATSTVLTKLTGPRAVQITWDKVTGASGYTVYFKKASASKWTKLRSINGRNNNKTSKTGLDAGTQYTFKVVAYWKGSDGTKYESTSSKQKSIYTLKAVPKVTVKKNTAAKVKVTWTNINGESGYQIQKMKKKGNVYVAVKTYNKGVNKTSIIIPHAKGSKFFYRVRPYKTEKINGVNKKVYGPWSGVKGIKL